MIVWLEVNERGELWQKLFQRFIGTPLWGTVCGNCDIHISIRKVKKRLPGFLVLNRITKMLTIC